MKNKNLKDFRDIVLVLIAGQIGKFAYEAFLQDKIKNEIEKRFHKKEPEEKAEQISTENSTKVEK